MLLRLNSCSSFLCVDPVVSSLSVSVDAVVAVVAVLVVVSYV